VNSKFNKLLAELKANTTKRTSAVIQIERTILEL